MKILVEKTVTQETVSEIHCNICGREIKKDSYGHFEDCLSVEKTWGYGTPVDGETHAFDICYDCYTQLVAGFKIPPQIANICTVIEW